MKVRNIYLVSLLIAMFLIIGNCPCEAQLGKALALKSAMKKGKNDKGNYVFKSGLLKLFVKGNELVSFAKSNGYVIHNLKLSRMGEYDVVDYLEFRTAEDYFPSELAKSKMDVESFIKQKVASQTINSDGTYTIKVSLKDYEIISKKLKKNNNTFTIVSNEALGINIPSGISKIFFPYLQKLVVVPMENLKKYRDKETLEKYYEDLQYARNTNTIRSLLAQHPEITEYPNDVLHIMVNDFWRDKLMYSVRNKSREDAIAIIKNLPDVVRNAPEMKYNIFSNANRFNAGDRFTRRDYYSIYHDYSLMEKEDIDSEDDATFNHIVTEDDIKYYVDYFPNGKFINVAKKWYDNGTYAGYYKELAGTLLDNCINKCQTFMNDKLAGRENKTFDFVEQNRALTTEGWWEPNLFSQLYYITKSQREPLHSKYADLSSYLIIKFSSDDKYNLLTKAKNLLSCTIILNGFVAIQNFRDYSLRGAYISEAFNCAMNECTRRYQNTNDERFMELHNLFENENNKYLSVKHQYKKEQKERLEAFKAEMCENCQIIGEETTFPKGYVDRYSFLFIEYPAQSEKAGRIVMKNRDFIVWKYIFEEGDIKIEITDGEYCKGEQYESVEKMIDAILAACKDRWCH